MSQRTDQFRAGTCHFFFFFLGNSLRSRPPGSILKTLRLLIVLLLKTPRHYPTVNASCASRICNKFSLDILVCQWRVFCITRYPGCKASENIGSTGLNFTASVVIVKLNGNPALLYRYLCYFRKNYNDVTAVATR